MQAKINLVVLSLSISMILAVLFNLLRHAYFLRAILDDFEEKCII